MAHLQLSTLCPLAAIFIVTAFIFLTRKTVPKKPISEAELSPALPSPSKLPIIGSFHHLLCSVPPHHRLRDLALRHGPLMRLRLFRTDFLVVSSRDAAEDVLKSHDLSFANRPTVPGAKHTNVIFAPYGEYWRQMRRLGTSELFAPHRIKTSAAIREQQVTELVERISKSGPAPLDVSMMVKLASTAVMVQVLMGRDCRHQEEFIDNIEEMTKVSEGLSVEDLFSPRKWLRVLSMKSKIERLQGNELMDRILCELEDEKKKLENPENITEMLLRIKNRGELSFPITVDTIKSEFAVLFTAGTETSSATVDWAMSELIRKPKIMKRVQDEVRHAMRGKTKLEEKDVEGLTYLKLVVKETLRLHPAIPLVPRECRERCRIQGHNVPAGQKVLVNLWALGRDPEYWDDAERFNPERFEGSAVDSMGRDANSLPFGAGRRICPGATFAVVFVELVLANLLFHFDWELPHGMSADDLDMKESVLIACTKKTGLCLIPKARTP